MIERINAPPTVQDLMLAKQEEMESPPFGEPFKEVLAGLAAGHELDLGVAIRDGAFEVTDAGLIIYDRNTALVGFFMALIRKLQPLATALAMDLDVWSKTLRDGK